jgi:hypothetical protein
LVIRQRGDHATSGQDRLITRSGTIKFQGFHELARFALSIEVLRFRVPDSMQCALDEDGCMRFA